MWGGIVVGNRNHEKVQVFIPDSVHAAICEHDNHSQIVLQENVKNNDTTCDLLTL